MTIFNFCISGLSLLFFSFAQGSKWACYHCSSTSKKVCQNIQIKKSCQPGNDMCLTREYEEEQYISFYKKKTIKHYEKLCGTKKKGCQYFCDGLIEMGHKCKKTCCFAKLCNHGIEPSSRNKRTYYNAAVRSTTKSWMTWFAILFATWIAKCA